ncbi:MAG: dihydrolipoamide acetyltransferase family protein [Agromyces sp.]
MSELRFALPDVGEGLTEAEIVSWRVSPGDAVALDQVFVEIETAKSLVELPSPVEGVVRELLIAEGATVEVGTPIIVIETAGAEPALAAEPAAPVESAEPAAEAEQASGAVLVGHGTSGHAPSRRKRHGGVTAPHSALAPKSSTPPPPPPTVPRSAVGPVLAKPPIRRLAKDLNVSLHNVVGTGPGGEILREDVVRAAEQVSVFRNIQTPDWTPGSEDRIPVKGVRKAIAQAMVQSAYSAPHVSVFVDVDATRSMEYVKRLKAAPEFAGVKVSPMLIMAKAMIWAVRRNPTVNAQWTDDEIIVKHYVNLGIAAATPRGLIVPNIKDAHQMTLLELATALDKLTQTAREGKTQPAEMQGGTITITNIGVFGMDTGTPILNPGEVGIVALGTIKPKPWVVDGEVRPRMVTTVGASFDHRVVDGDVASRFVADIASVLEEPALLLD